MGGRAVGILIPTWREFRSNLCPSPLREDTLFYMRPVEATCIHDILSGVHSDTDSPQPTQHSTLPLTITIFH